jgi:uncharacterized CHY-type Zn-finger protein
MKIICAWCKKLIQASNDNEISHGICKECEAKFLEQLEKTSQ